MSQKTTFKCDRCQETSNIKYNWVEVKIRSTELYPSEVRMDLCSACAKELNIFLRLARAGDSPR